MYLILSCPFVKIILGKFFLTKDQGSLLSYQSPKLIYYYYYYINLFIYFWLRWVFIAMRGLSLVVARGGLLLIVVCELLIAVASLVAEHRL